MKKIILPCLIILLFTGASCDDARRNTSQQNESATERNLSYQLPAGWSNDVPAYESVTGNAASATPTDQEAGAILQLETADSKDTIVAYYQEELEAENWKIQATLEGEYATSLLATKGDRSITVVIADSGDERSITAVLSKKE